MTIAGGVALILFAARFMRKGLDRLFGPRLADWMQRLTDSRGRAFLTGMGVAIAAPSSTTVSVLAVQSIQHGHLNCRRSLAIMLGANVGFTLMVLLIALRLEGYAPWLILGGVLLYQFTRREALRGAGQVVLSLGLIFVAIGIIKTAGSSFEPDGGFIQLLELAQDYPVWVAVIAAALTVGLQSSTAAIALVIGLAAGEVVQLPLTLAVVVGANVGIAVSTLLVGWPLVEARRMAMGNLLAKAALAVAVLATLPVLVELVARVPGGLDKQIALSHTAFNVVLAALALPLLGPLERVVSLMAPEPPESQQKAFGPRYIRQGPIEGFSLASGQSMREILRVSEIVREMLHEFWQALVHRDEELARRVQERDDQVDLLDTEIKKFVTQLAKREGDQDEKGELNRQLRYLNELETIGDVIDKNLCELAVKRAHQRVEFSDEGWQELSDLYEKVTENLLIAETAFTTRDQALARKLLRHKERLGEYERILRDRHFQRLTAGIERTQRSSAVHLDLLTHLKRINNYVSHVAYAILDDKQVGQRESA
ncbi:MAG: Na/Pi cotransporter family protein [Phycisphaeraceae bacterium]